MGLAGATQIGEVCQVMHTPRSVDVDITAKCNLRCKYCYHFDNQEISYEDLPTEEWLQFFDELGRCAVMNICLAGGEPFIRDDLPELLEGIVRNRMRFSILSNGALISDEIAAFIKNTGRCDYVQISIDGSIPETHDSCRGKGSFVKAIRGIQKLQRHNVPVVARVTIHHHNVHDLENIARLLLEDLKLSSFSTNSAGVFGSCHQNAEDVLLTTADRIVAMETLLRLSEKYKGRISALAGPLAEARNWDKMEMARRRGDSPFPNGGCLTSCGCTTNKIAVRSDGVITPCNLIPNIELGRINRDSLREIWQKSPKLNGLRNRNAISLNGFDFCRECSYIPYCTGNCPASAYNLIGEVNHPSPDACLRRFLESGGTIPCIENLQPSCRGGEAWSQS